MGERKFRLHMEEKEYVFQYEGDRMLDPEDLLKYLHTFRAGVLGPGVETKGAAISLFKDPSHPMGFDR